MKIIVFIFFAAGAFIAWNKSTHDAPKPPSLSAGSKAKTCIPDNLFYNYAFDAQDMVVVITRSNGNKDEYEYSRGRRRIYPGQVYQYSYIEQLDADGYTKHITRNDLPEKPLYFYKADRTIVERISKQKGKSTVFDYFQRNW